MRAEWCDEDTRLEYLLEADSTDIWLEVVHFDAGSLFEDCNSLQVGGDEPWRALVCIFGRDVTTDSARFKDDEPVIVLDGCEYEATVIRM